MDGALPELRGGALGLGHGRRALEGRGQEMDVAALPILRQVRLAYDQPR